MVVTEAQAPIFLTAPDGCKGGAVPKCKRRTRKMWKCPEVGCYRVAVYVPTEEEEKKLSERACPGCGLPTDADGIKKSRAMNLCSKCRAARAIEKVQMHENLKKLQVELQQEYEKKFHPETVEALA